VYTLRGHRRYDRVDITGLTGVTMGQRAALLALGALDRPLADVSGRVSSDPTSGLAERR
jgi:hypothetical protein